MAKVITASLQFNGPRSRAAVSTKRVRDEDGRIKTIMTVDLNSETFGDDFRRVFQRNVTRARRENRETFGTSEIVPPDR